MLCRVGQVVVLSPDATEPLQGLDSSMVYVIGGMVDRTMAKHATLGYSQERQLQTRRLPIQEHAQALGLGKGACKRPVLNVNDVLLALLEFQASGDWCTALDKAIPHRKRGIHAASTARGAAAAASEPEAEPAEAVAHCPLQG